MLDRESIETYKSIRLPRDLRPDILARHTEQSVFLPQKFLRPAAVLCSLCLILTVLLTSVMQSGGIYADGVKIGRNALAVQTQSVEFTGGIMRASFDPASETQMQTADACIPLSFTFGENVYLAVHNGSLLVTDENGNAVFAGQAGEVKEDARAFWVVTGCEAASPLTAEVFTLDGESLTVLTLTYDAADSMWHIARKSSEK